MSLCISLYSSLCSNIRAPTEKGLDSAIKLCEDLLSTVRSEFDKITDQPPPPPPVVLLLANNSRDMDT